MEIEQIDAEVDSNVLANAIRALAMDAVQAANSGHPGMPMGMAEIAVALWTRHLRHNPANPHWADRDRFVLSNGHGSMLQYALLHLSGYDLPLEELKPFRQLHSRTPGHPEFGRPCDAVETAVAWTFAIERQEGPTALLLSRQTIEPSWHASIAIADIRRGGYVLADSVTAPRAVVIATGSEVPLALKAARLLAEEGLPVRVVSMPSTSVFDRQTVAYRQSIVSPHLPCVAVEAGVTGGWYKYVGREGRVIGIDRFGESAPAEAVYETLGVTVENVVAAVRTLV